MSQEDNLHSRILEDEPTSDAVRESLTLLCADAPSRWISFAETLRFRAGAIALISRFPGGTAQPLDLLAEALLKLRVGALDPARSAFLLKEPMVAVALYKALQPKGTLKYSERGPHPPEDEAGFCRFYAQKSSRCQRNAGIMS
eukprot:m.9138 g.9138  ORF g.9138 m.9138 type:complete len:143 (+) comp21115_c0_seq1:70-498(+)